MGTLLPETSPDGTFSNFCWLTGAFASPTNPPDFLTMELSGILKGDLWLPTDPEPPNGRYVLPQEDSTTWRLISTEIVFAIGWTSISTEVFVLLGPPTNETVFLQISSTCRNSLSNSFTNPANRHFFSGSVRALGIH